MRYANQMTFAAVLFTGAALVGVAPALAGPDEAQQDSFWAHQSAGQPAPNGQTYMQVDPRDAKADNDAQSADAANPYFDHAEGTMSTHAGEAVQTPAQGNGRYVASYGQYMTMDPRDTKADPNASNNVDADNIYFNHAQGTMSGN